MCFSIRLLSEVTSTKSSISHDQYLTRQQRAPPPDRSYAHCALRLLDLLDTLYHRTTSVFNNETGTSDTAAGVSHMWNVCWCPLLEVMIINNGMNHGSSSLGCGQNVL